MSYDERKSLITNIEKLRKGRKLISICNFDRISSPPLPGLNISFHAELKECLYRVLKETIKAKEGIDILIYTRGGDTNSVWPLISLIREYDPDFEVLVPFRAHSAGTLFSIGSKKIIMSKLAELSPIDPSTGNQFNPIDELNKKNRLGISVEDVEAFKIFLEEGVKMLKQEKTIQHELSFITPLFQELIRKVHPLAIGNVQRVHNMIKKLAQELLQLHPIENEKCEEIIDQLTTKPCSHLHMFNRSEAQKILSKKRIQYADEELDNALDILLKQYEDDFSLRDPLFISRLMKDEKQEKDFYFIGGVVESEKWGYKFETEGKILQFSRLPKNINIQLPPGQIMPLIPGMPKDFHIEIFEQRWKRNIEKRGITK